MRLAVLSLAFAAVPLAGAAQPALLARGDLAAATGMLSTKHADSRQYHNWDQDIVGGFTAGLYWTDHLKAEIGLAWSGTALASQSELLWPTGGYVHVTHEYQNRLLSIGQTYQFRRNAAFHPFVSVGVSVDRERHDINRPIQTTSTDPYGSIRTFVIVPPLSHTDTRVRARPFVGAGFKAYFSERAFFRSDLNLGIQSGIRQVTWNTGIGVDF